MSCKTLNDRHLSCLSAEVTDGKEGGQILCSYSLNLFRVTAALGVKAGLHP